VEYRSCDDGCRRVRAGRCLKRAPLSSSWGNKPTQSFESVRDADAVGIGIWDTASQDADLADAEAKKIDPAVPLNARLYPDMFPLVRQVREATSHAANACGRLAGAELLTFANTEASISELQERITKTIDFIKGLKPTQIDGTEDKEITINFPSGNERKFTGQVLLLNFSLPNFYFHYTTAYDILRNCGVELAKRDFMGTPVTLP
jgi:uncharacterized protein